jgi:iron(III) transport system ATP-binding protein
LASVELRELTKRFGSLAVVDNVSLRIDHGQLVCLLGPSGCGKTTTLRLIAGFLEPSDGAIHVGDRIVSSRARTLPPEQRKMSMIFQSYALWPHMTGAVSNREATMRAHPLRRGEGAAPQDEGKF